jgi:hypothetical protein
MKLAVFDVRIKCRAGMTMANIWGSVSCCSRQLNGALSTMTNIWGSVSCGRQSSILCLPAIIIKMVLRMEFRTLQELREGRDWEREERIRLNASNLFLLVGRELQL